MSGKAVVSDSTLLSLNWLFIQARRLWHRDDRNTSRIFPPKRRITRRERGRD